jgi:hypothetical protein
MKRHHPRRITPARAINVSNDLGYDPSAHHNVVGHGGRSDRDATSDTGRLFGFRMQGRRRQVQTELPFEAGSVALSGPMYDAGTAVPEGVQLTRPPASI